MKLLVEPIQSLKPQPDLTLSRYGPKIAAGNSTETITR
jgi:hypothetical protein